MKMTATYSSNDMHIVFTADAEKSDYGVHGSPVWYEPQDIDFAHRPVICGVECDPAALPADLVSALLALADECEFQTEE